MGLRTQVCDFPGLGCRRCSGQDKGGPGPGPGAGGGAGARAQGCLPVGTALRRVPLRSREGGDAPVREGQTRGFGETLAVQVLPSTGGSKGLWGQTESALM